MVAAPDREILSAERVHALRRGWLGGDQSGDTGVIHLDDNRVESVNDSITNAGPSWRPQLPEPKVVELVRAGRIVLAHWESGDLAAQIRRFARALKEFVQLPDER